MAKRTYRKRSTRGRRSVKQQIISILVLAVLAFLVYYFLPEENEVPTPSYSTYQNEEGFYYYQSVGSEDYTYDARNLIGEALMSELNTITNATKTYLW